MLETIAQWVEQELRNRGAGGRPLSYERAKEQTGLSPATFTRLVGAKPLSEDTYVRLAPWLHRSKEEVLREAGYSAEVIALYANDPIRLDTIVPTTEEDVIRRRVLEELADYTDQELERALRVLEALRDNDAVQQATKREREGEPVAEGA